MRLIMKLVLKTFVLFFLLEVHNFKYFLLRAVKATHSFARPPICNRSSCFKIDRKSQTFYVIRMNGEKRNSLKMMSDKWSVRQWYTTTNHYIVHFRWVLWYFRNAGVVVVCYDPTRNKRLFLQETTGWVYINPCFRYR